MASNSPSNKQGFDFYFGSWSVVNRRLKNRWIASDDWATFPAVSICRPVLNGSGNEDQFTSEGIVGMTLRLYNPTNDQWSLYWVNAKDGVLQPPVVGRFVDGRGEFFGEDTDDGKHIRVRYTWSNITHTTARWDQAFSVDEGHSWETNWIMDMTRTVAT